MHIVVYILTKHLLHQTSRKATKGNFNHFFITGSWDHWAFQPSNNLHIFVQYSLPLYSENSLVSIWSKKIVSSLNPDNWYLIFYYNNLQIKLPVGLTFPFRQNYGRKSYSHLIIPLYISLHKNQSKYETKIIYTWK